MRRNIVTVAVVVAVAVTALTVGYARLQTASRAGCQAGGDLLTNATAQSPAASNISPVERPLAQPAGGAKSPAPQSAGPGEGALPPALLSLVDATKEGIHPKDVTELAAGRQNALIEAYHATDSIARRARIGRVLAYVGDERAVSLLTNALTMEYAGRELTWEQARELGWATYSLGFLARRYDSAFSFLKQGIDPAFWSRQPGLPFSEGYARDSLVGLALSRRPEVRRSSRACVPRAVQR